MASFKSSKNSLPAGWDCRVDNFTGKRYYINHLTHHTSMEDPRIQYQEEIPLHEFTANNRLGLMMGTNSLKRQQSTTDSQKPSTTDQAVTKISAMFPTVTETHIRTLLHKYHNREAVVMSALQVEKHPLTTPGPYTPPPGARVLPGVGLFAVTPPHTPRASPLPPRFGSPRPHSSPKMKLRYLKSVFPVVEETILLDTLSSSDNNVHQATETLLNMGFDKRATPPPRVCLQRQAPTQSQADCSPQTPHRMKSVEEKEGMKVRLRKKHPDTAERVVSIALDSVDFDETKADQILNMMMDSFKPAGFTKSAKHGEVSGEKVNEVIVEEPSQAASPESCPTYIEARENGHDRSADEFDSMPYQSTLTTGAVGPNRKLCKGPNQALLLVSRRPDYVAWTGSEGLARGPDPTLQGPHTVAQGPNPSLRKGPRGLSRGSIYSQLAGLTLAESRGK